MHISSSYAKIFGETNVRTREIPRSGSKAKDGEREKKRGLNDGDNNGQATHVALKPPGPKIISHTGVSPKWVKSKRRRKKKEREKD